MSKKEFNGHKVCEALSDPTRAEILRYLVRAYPNPRTISDIERALLRRVSTTTISFHLRKLREAELIATNGRGKGFKAVSKALGIKFDGEGFYVEGVK